MKSATLPSTVRDTIPGWVRWLAQDANGVWWGYEHEPNRSDEGWYENEVGRYIKLAQSLPNPQWHSTLMRHPASGLPLRF